MMASTSQLFVPLSQNTAPVFKFECLYTHDLVRKQKRWQDGVLAFHTFNKRVMVYDLTNNFIGDTHWRDTESVQVGDDIRLDRGVLVTVGEAKGRKDQDISEIFARRNVTRESNLPPGNVALGRATAQKPRSITAVLEAGRNKFSRAIPQASSSAPNGSSPYDTSSERPPKRQRLAQESPTRQALLEKPLMNRTSVNATRNCDQLRSKPARQVKDMREESENRVNSCISPSERNVMPKLQQTRISRETQAMEDAMPKKKRSKKKPERIKDSKVTNADVALATTDARPKNCNKQESRMANNVTRAQSNERSIIDQSKSDNPKQRLVTSKSRRKKLIFNSISIAETNQTGYKAPHTKETITQVGQSDYPITEEHSYPITKEPARDVILISSPPKDWTEFESSEDEHSGFPRHSRRFISGSTSGNYEKPGPDLFVKPVTTISLETVPEIDPVKDDQALLQKKSTDVVDDYPGLTTDENLLAALVEDPIEVGARSNNHEGTEGSTVASITTNIQSRNDDVCNSVIQLPSRKTVDLSKLSERAETNSPDSALLSSPDSASPPRIVLAAASNRQKGDKAVKHDILLPTTTALDPSLTTTDPPAAQTSLTKPSDTRNSNDTLDLSAQPELAESATDRPLIPPLPSELSPPKQRSLKSIAPIPSLLRIPPNQTPAQTAYQKPLPQFRPPQQTSVPAVGVARPRRSPLRKSLTTSADGKSNSIAVGNITSLARAGSDNGVEMVGDVQREYDDAGPWSREAFDLFGWTPDVPKGKILGPVAGRACGCRAAAAASAAKSLNVAGGS